MKEFKSQKIKNVIKTLLKKKAITYEDLAEQLECSVPTVTRILGPEELTLNRLLQLCEIVEIDLAELEALTKEGDEKDEEFTQEQEAFLAKNKNFFAYLMALFNGETPKQIAEKYRLNQRSTDKYLIGLEKNELIRVTAKRVKPAFKKVPSLGKGLLGRLYYEAMVKTAGQFFINNIAEGMLDTSKPSDKLSTKFGIQTMRVSKRTYESWVAEQELSIRNFEKTADFENKTKDPSELMTVVAIYANTMVKNDYAGLKILENVFGDIVNI